MHENRLIGNLYFSIFFNNWSSLIQTVKVNFMEKSFFFEFFQTHIYVKKEEFTNKNTPLRKGNLL